jgi:hypothetical protein
MQEIESIRADVNEARQGIYGHYILNDRLNAPNLSSKRLGAVLDNTI